MGYSGLFISFLYLEFIMIRKKFRTKDIQSFFSRNEKDIIQIMLAMVLILYITLQRFVS